MFSLSGCIGGGGSGGSSGEGPVGDNGTPVGEQTPPGPKVVLKLSARDVTGHRGDALPIVFTGSWTATGLEDDSAYVKIFDERGEFITPVTSLTTENAEFSIETVVDDKLKVGRYTPRIAAVVCKDIQCESVYEGSKIAPALSVEILEVPEWQTHQANASHNGYVPLLLSNSSFNKLWEWRRSPSGVLGGIHPPVAGNGKVYVAAPVYHDQAELFSFDEITGEEVWKTSFGNMPWLNPPALNGESVFVATSGHSDTKVWAVDRKLGEVKFQSDFSSQWGRYMAPTVFRDQVFQTGGYYGGYTYAFSTEDGERKWAQPSGASWGSDTPAADEKHVYVHDGVKLSVIDRTDGGLVGEIPDPFGSYYYDYSGAPVIGDSGAVFAYSGAGYGGRVITKYDISEMTHVWSTESSYEGYFAIADGVIYAARSGTATLDALDEETGNVLWSWTSLSAADSSFSGNIIVTKNVLFFSTNANLYAIDLATREELWSYDAPGMISISDNRILLLAPGFRDSDGRLIAFDLRPE